MLTFSRHETEPLGADRVRRLLTVVLLIALVLSGLHALGVDKFSLRLEGEPVGFQANLAQAFVAGDLDLGPAPAELMALSDPWDPDANRSFRYDHALHDYAYFDGRIHSPFGPTPALLAHVPYRLLTGNALDPSVTTFLWSIGLFMASFTAYRMLVARFAHHRPWWADLAAVAALGLAGPVLWITSIGRSYEESIACGAFLLLFAIALLSRATSDPDRPSAAVLAGAGLALGLAAGARPHLIGAGFLVALTALWLIRRRPQHWRLGLIALSGPYVVVILALLAYNHVRFGSPFEFGTSFQMAGMDLREYPLFDPVHLAPNLADYLFGGPRLQADWPHVHLLENTFANDPSHHTNEPVVGALTAFPVIAIGVRCLPMAIRSSSSTRSSIVFQLGGLLIVALGLLIAVSLPFSSSTMRYTVDFVPVLALVAVVAAVVAFADTTGTHRLLWRTWLIALAWSSVVGVLLPLTPCPGTGSC